MNYILLLGERTIKTQNQRTFQRMHYSQTNVLFDKSIILNYGVNKFWLIYISSKIKQMAKRP